MIFWLFTAYADIALAVEGMKRGAFDFIVKPWDNEKLVVTLTAAYNASAKKNRTEAVPSSDMYWGTSPATARPSPRRPICSE